MAIIKFDFALLKKIPNLIKHYLRYYPESKQYLFKDS